MEEGNFKLHLAEIFHKGAWKSNYSPFKDVTTGILGQDKYVVRFNWVNYGATEAMFRLPLAPVARQEKLKLFEQWVAEFKAKLPPVTNPLQ